MCVAAKKQPFGEYGGGAVYIEAPEEYSGSEAGDIHILDYRFEKNPDFKIVNSYRIHKLSDMRRICTLLIEYANEKPCKGWNRSLYSCVLEWKLHNIFYDLGI